MHSPVLVNFNPNYEVEEELSDWLYDSDEFYDDVPARDDVATQSAENQVPPSSQTKRKRVEPAVAKRKRRRTKDGGALQDVGFGEAAYSEKAGRPHPAPVVIWKKAESESNVPLFREDDSERVSLLGDWKDRLCIPRTRTAYGKCKATSASQTFEKEELSTASTRTSTRKRAREPEEHARDRRSDTTGAVSKREESRELKAMDGSDDHTSNGMAIRDRTGSGKGGKAKNDSRPLRQSKRLRKADGPGSR